MKTALIVGAGEGMGNHIAEKFAHEGYRIGLIARNQDKLDKYVQEFIEKGYEAFSVSSDILDSDNFYKTMDEITVEYDIDVLVYNAAFMQKTIVTELSSNVMMEHFRVNLLGAQICVEKLLPGMIKKQEGAILFTGGMFGVYPNANSLFSCMSMYKAALRQYAQMLNSSLKDKGVYAGIVNIMGTVGENDKFKPSNIAEKYWQLYQDKSEFEYNYE